MTKDEVLFRSFFDRVQEQGFVAGFTFLYDHLSADDFIQFGLKKRNATSAPELFSISDFWNQFILKKEILVSLLESKSWDRFIHWYFNNEEFYLHEFIQCYADIDPNRLIRDVRLNQVFLKERTHESLSLIRFPYEYKNHQKCWKELFLEDQNGWEEVIRKASCWSEIGVEEFLTYVIHWIEQKRFQDDEDENSFHLSICYNFLIELYVSKFPERTKSFSKERFQILFNGRLLHRNKKFDESFQAVYDWADMNEKKIMQYAWDLNIIPVFHGNSMGFEYYDPSKMDNWRLNGKRYLLNELRYLDLGRMHASYEIHENGLKIPGENEEAQELNLELLIKELSVHSVLSDLCLDEIAVNGSSYNLHDFVGTVVGYSFNRSNRYEAKLMEFHENSRSWEESFLKLNQYSASIDVDCDPYFLLTKERYINHIKRATSLEQMDVFSEIAEQLTTKFSEDHVFNRHNVTYNVWHTPFVALGDYLFCPMIFFARNSWFYSIADIAMKNHHVNRKLEKSSTTKMEKELMQIFQSANENWQCSTPDENQKGDVDLLVSDSRNYLFIQLKRTYFRTNLRDGFFEELMVDKKAISQLNEREELLKDEYSGRIIKWYVSTSFENANQEIEGCAKINYFELIWALRNKKFEFIEHLERYIRSDEILKEDTSFKIPE